MKRDMNLVRKILLRCEENPDGDFHFDAYSEEQVAYHGALLIEAGFIDGRVLPGDNEIPAGVAFNSLTWRGHEFLDDVRNENVWNKTKEAAGSQFQTISLAVVQELAKGIVRGMIGLPLA